MTGANSKAFDRIDHNILLNKLLQMGVHPPPPFINWIANFSTDRQQSIRVGPTIPSGNQSALVFRKEKKLDPLLSLIMVNDLGGSSNIVTFVDDSSYHLGGYSKELPVSPSINSCRL